MKNSKRNYVRNILTPSILLSGITGIFTGVVIFLFQLAADKVFDLSGTIYSSVRSDPKYLPLLLGGALILGLVSVCAVKFLGIAKGGGIPTAIALMRGLIDFRWLRSIFAVFSSALVTFLSGIPLGNEGPSVQMGTAIGRGTVRLFSRKNTAWDRYIMTGGAAAGFAAATAAPLTGLFFILEEAHRRFSPMLFMSAASAVISSTITLEILNSKFHVAHNFLPFEVTINLEIKYLYLACVVGLLCGAIAIAFTKAHEYIGSFLNNKLSRLSVFVKIPAVFVLTALTGFFISEILGTGRSLISELMYGNGAWYMLLIYFCVRAVLLMVANNLGVTGGLFVPSLTFGAIIGSLSTKIFIELGILPEEYAPILIIIGITAFLSAVSRIPITAVIFAIEAMNGLSNIIPIVLGATLSYAVIEIAGILSFNDLVIETKVKQENSGKPAHLVDSSFVIQPGAFVIGKEIRDILWPPTCVITSVRKSHTSDSHSPLLGAGDTLHLHYRTTTPEYTFEKLENLIGKQGDNLKKFDTTVSDSHQVPEN